MWRRWQKFDYVTIAKRLKILQMNKKMRKNIFAQKLIRNFFDRLITRLDIWQLQIQAFDQIIDISSDSILILHYKTVDSSQWHCFKHRTLHKSLFGSGWTKLIILKLIFNWSLFFILGFRLVWGLVGHWLTKWRISIASWPIDILTWLTDGLLIDSWLNDALWIDVVSLPAFDNSGPSLKTNVKLRESGHICCISVKMPGFCSEDQFWGRQVRRRDFGFVVCWILSFQDTTIKNYLKMFNSAQIWTCGRWMGRTNTVLCAPKS